ncbi:MAG: hydroxymethylbilane synthase [Clostridiales bacterium]|nr:hydroxymethylbilane synthase [Clostridiales bacterium]
MTMSRIVRVGSRDSVLAVNQARIVMEAIKMNNPDLEPKLVTIKTIGDKILDKSLDEIGGKGLFVKELEQALIDGSVDIAVHSYKDMPYEENESLPIVALSKREAPFDVLVLPKGTEGLGTKLGAGQGKPKPVGTSSLRRAIQFARLESGFETASVRGNVLTRLSKLDSGQYSALILAQAGLVRLGLQDRISRVFAPEEMIPSGSQGILAVQGRLGEDFSYLRTFHDLESEIVSKAERQYLKTLGVGCHSPVAVYGQISGNELLLTGMYVGPAGNVKTGNIGGDAEKAESLGEALAIRLRSS